MTGRMLLASGLLMLVLGVPFAVLLVAVADLRASARAARNSEAVLTTANELERLVVDLETGVRGFVLTGQQQFLEPFTTARSSLPARAAALERLSARNAEQARTASRITQAANAYVEQYAVPLIDAARRGDPAARAVAATAEGKRRVDAMRVQFDTFIATEGRLARARQQRADDAARRAVLAVVGGLAVALLLVLAFAAYLARAIVRPVLQASQMAVRLAGGDLGTRMPATGVAEVGQLERAFNQMAGSLERNREELAERAAEQAALRRVATLVARGAAPSQVFSAVAEEMAQRLGAEVAKVLRYEPDGTATVVGGWSAPGMDIPIGTRLTVEGQGVAVSVLHTGRPARAERQEGPPGSVAACFHDRGVHSTVGSPILVEGRLWGVAIAGSRRPEALAAGSEERILQFTELVATAVANAEAQAELTASRARIVATADDTRRRLERDLHDGAQQRLVSLALQLRAAQAVVPPGLEELATELDQVAAGMDSALEELREFARGIHPAILAEGGLGPALRTLARRSAVPVELEVRTEGRLPEPVEIGAYYVVSEALANAAKHARASAVFVEVEAADEVLRVSVRDDGVGGADLGRGSGLVGLTDRVEALGGRISVASPRGAGTALQVELPLAGHAGAVASR